MNDYPALRDMLIKDEGYRLKPYKDTAGKLTIGVGRNLDDTGISGAEAMLMLDNDIRMAVNALNDTLPWWSNLSEVRQHVLVNMCFNLGIHRLIGFKQALAAMEAGDYNTAANEMENSDWSHQVGSRAMRLASLMRNGQ